MSAPTTEAFDWDPHAPEVRRDQVAAFDGMRARCPVARSEAMHWSLFRHADVLRVLLAHDDFGNDVSAHRSVPNGMDPPEHAAWRGLIEPFFAPGRVAAFEPACRAIAHDAVAQLRRGVAIDVARGFAQDFALAVQCAFMGWPPTLHAPLRRWIERNHAATRDRDRAAARDVALAFDGTIREILAARRRPDCDADPDDVTGRLMRLRLDGRPIDDETIVGIVRNWTVGELGTIAASVGIVAHRLAREPALQASLRQCPDRLPAAIDEILRADAPLVSNRRVARREATIGGRTIRAGETLTLMWASANRDEAVFGDPDVVRPDRDPGANLLYGAGIHACPGAGLARMELRVATAALLAGTSSIRLADDRPAVRAIAPAGGWSSVALIVD